LLAGESHRERVLSFEEEKAYLIAAASVGDRMEDAYQQALKGIRAVIRGQQPRRPDAYLLRDVATILIHCALRPQGVFRLKWAHLLSLDRGKTVTKPLSLRMLGLLLSEKQIPQIVENLESGAKRKEALERIRQSRPEPVAIVGIDR
jgi:hypothetical protein